MAAEYAELVEVLDNPKISEKRYEALVRSNANLKAKLKADKPKKKGGKRRGKPRLDPMMIALGAAAVQVADIYLVQYGPLKENIPDNIRRWSGLVWAALGFMLTKMKGKKSKTMQSIYVGMLAGGVAVQAFKEAVRQKDDALAKAIDAAFGVEAQAKVDGLGLWPDAPEVQPMLGVLAMDHAGGQGFGELQWGNPAQALGAAWDAGTLGGYDHGDW